MITYSRTFSCLTKKHVIMNDNRLALRNHCTEKHKSIFLFTVCSLKITHTRPMKTEMSNKITYSTVNSVKANVFWIVKQSCGETSSTGEGRDHFSLLSSKQGALSRILKERRQRKFAFQYSGAVSRGWGVHLSAQCWA